MLARQKFRNMGKNCVKRVQKFCKRATGMGFGAVRGAVADPLPYPRSDSPSGGSWGSKGGDSGRAKGVSPLGRDALTSRPKELVENNWR
jgi:hypothetical protein